MKLTQVITNHHQISASSRAFQFGDGHFTTILIIDGQVQLWAYHKARLLQANKRLFFPELNLLLIENALSDIARNKKNCIVKILISRGNSQRGYAVPEGIEAEVYLFCADYHNQLFTYPNGIDLVTLNTKIAQQPLLAGLKHCNRLEQVLIKQELMALAKPDGIVLDLQDNVIETSLANIYLNIDSQWCTPRLDFAGVEGVKRAYLLDKLNHSSINSDVNRPTPSCLIRQIKSAELKYVKAAVISNALIGFVPVSQIDNMIMDMQIAREFIEQVQ